MQFPNRKMYQLFFVVALVMALLPGAALAQSDAPSSDIVDTAVAAGDFNTLVAAVDAAGLVETLKGEGPFTVFAPTDAAFAPLVEDGTVDALLTDPEGQLKDILLYHVISGKVMAADLSDGLEATTVQGSPVTFTIGDGVAMVNGANIVMTDIETSNGVIHIIDSVILPPVEEAMVEEAAPAEEAMMSSDIVDTAVAAGDFNTLVAAVDAAGLVETLKGEGPFTVFAPTDAAFAPLVEDGTVDALLTDPEGQLKDILLYHVISGKVMAADLSDGLEATTVQGSPVTFTIGDGVAMVNDANIVMTDIETSNGVIHVIDSVIVPPAEEAMVEAAAPAEEAMTSSDIVDTAVAAGDFNTLVAAVQAAGLVETLKGEGPFTVFAPTDAAFAPLVEDGTVDALLTDPEGQLKDILLYHVISGKVMAADLSDGLEATTVQGSPVTFTLGDGVAMVNGANIVMTDIETSNGVIHVIDSVIVPPAEEAMAEAAAPAASAPASSSSEDMAPASMPVTGGESGTNVALLAIVLAGAMLAGALFFSRRRLA